MSAARTEERRFQDGHCEEGSDEAIDPGWGIFPRSMDNTPYGEFLKIGRPRRLMILPTVKILALGQPDQARMIDLIARVRAAAGRSAVVALSDASVLPCKGGSVSVVATAAGQMKRIEGTVVDVEPRTMVSSGRLVVQDNLTGALVELPAPVVPGE